MPPPVSPEPRQRLLPAGGLVVCAYCFPPMSVGPAFILDRLLGRFDLAASVVFAGTPERYSAHAEASGAARARVVHRDLPRRWPGDREVRLGRLALPVPLRKAGNVAVGLRLAASLARALRRDDAAALLGVYPKQHFLLAAALAARSSRKPFAVYFMDVYVEGLPRGRRVARALERAVLRRAGLVFAMSAPHREQLAGRVAAHGGTARVVELPHPYEPADGGEAAPLPGEPSVLFTGAIYDAQADALRRLVAALGSPELAGLDPRLHLLSQTSPADVAAEGIEVGGRVTLRAAASAETLAAQRGADVLFLPIAFGAKEAVRRTASPSKLPEYLASGRPILVHAPEDAYVARYAREHGFAEVVSEPDTEALAQAVRRLATDEARRAELAAAAARTLERHRAERVAATFRDELAALVRRAAP